MLNKSIELCPAQQETFKWLVNAWDMAGIFHLWASDGYGRIAVLAALHAKFGGVRIGLKEFVRATQERHPLALEDALYEVLMDAFADNEIVIVDDWHVATAATEGSCHFYPRSGYLDSPAGALASYVLDAGKKLVVATDGRLSSALRDRSVPYSVNAFESQVIVT